MRTDSRNPSPIFHRRSPQLAVAAIVLLALACATLLPPPTAKPAATAVPPTAEAQPTATSSPTPVAIESYLGFAPLYQWSVPKTSQVRGVALSPDTKRVALITSRYKNKWWLELRNSETGDLLWELDLNEKAAYNSLSFAPDGGLIAVGLDHGRILVRDSADGSAVQTLTGHTFAVRMTAFSPDGRYLASGASDNTARVWQVSNGSAKATYKIKTDVRDIAWSPDSRYLAVTSNYVAVFNVVEGGANMRTYYDGAGDTKDMGEVAFSPSGHILIGAGNWFNVQNQSWRYRILLWDFPQDLTAPTKIPIDDAIEDTAVSPDGQILLGVYKDKGKLLVINIHTREIIGQVNLGPKLYMSYAPDIHKFALVSTKTNVAIWSLQP